MSNRSVTLGVLAIVPFWVSMAAADEQPWFVEELHVSAPTAEVAGVLWRPKVEGQVPCVVICGGSLSHDRDGRFYRQGVPERDALKRLAEALVRAGYASVRYDKVGHRGSKPKPGWRGTYSDRATVVAEIIKSIRGRPDIGQIIAVGESAGAYHLCLAAKAGTQAEGYIFLGGLCRSGVGMYAYTFGKLVEWAERSPENLAWAERHARYELALGRKCQEWFDAAAAGKDAFKLVDGDFRRTLRVMERRREEIEMPPDEMFRYIKAPALALAGDKDLNVAPEDAENIARVIKSSGHHRAQSVRIPGADHNFQITPEDEDERIRERYTLKSFERPYDPRLYREVIAWLNRYAPRPRGVAKIEVDAVTEYTPEKVYLAAGIQIIDNILDPSKVPGVGTLEGRIGPLILGIESQCHFIDMPAGMYTHEHPHSSGSYIYTVRGRWVLTSAGRRHLMKPGTLFTFAPNTPTGYELPFDEDAFILIFKDKRLSKDEREFIEYLRGLKTRLQEERDEGHPMRLKELPSDHPARVFARKVNSRFDTPE